ncbi:hypothetical protein BCAR13_870049 [Paraburkholderia caribensis]|nr:hypothetical protein BCAR13_870049 [Paraburkholderia caribensis]
MMFPDSITAAAAGLIAEAASKECVTGNSLSSRFFKRSTRFPNGAFNTFNVPVECNRESPRPFG